MSSSYESLVDPTDFRTLVHYLEIPQSSIHFIIHANSRSTLLELAEMLGERMSEGRLTSDYARDLLAHHIACGKALITPRRQDPAQDYSYIVHAAAIPRDTLCHVIYMPPFYLSATEGLFERLEIQQTEAKHAQITPKPRKRMKI